MIGEDPQRHIRLGVIAVAPPREPLGFGYDRPQQVCVPHRRDILQRHQYPLEAGARVDVGLGEIAQRAILLAVELHEHQVPDLHVPLFAAAPAGATVGSPGRATIEVDLRGRPARPGVPHLPEVVPAKPLYAPHRHADRTVPDLGRLVVVGVHCHPEALPVQPEHLGQESPRQGYRPGLEVVPKAEIAQHLEEREVPGGPAYQVDVVVLAPDPDAFLDARGPRVRRDLFTQEIGYELVHTRVGEKGRAGVVRDQPGGRNRCMSTFDEILGEGASERVGIHVDLQVTA